MDEETQKIIENQMKQLPQDVKEAIISVDYKTKLQEITKRQKLMIDQAAKLEMETTLVMIGLEPLSDFLDNVERELNVNNIEAKNIILDVNEQIFKSIRASLEAMNAEPINGDEEKLPTSEKQKSTDHNESDLDRDQILREIEDPSLIGKKDIAPIIVKPSVTEIEMRPVTEIQTVPGEKVKDVPADIVQTKMSGKMILSQETIDAKPENRLPEANTSSPKKIDYPGKVDPYREPIN